MSLLEKRKNDGDGDRDLKGANHHPAEGPQRHGPHPGDQVDFVRMDDGHYAVVPASHSIRTLKGIVPRPDRPVSLEDMQAAIETQGSDD